MKRSTTTTKTAAEPIKGRGNKGKNIQKLQTGMEEQTLRAIVEATRNGVCMAAQQKNPND